MVIDVLPGRNVTYGSLDAGAVELLGPYTWCLQRASTSLETTCVVYRLPPQWKLLAELSLPIGCKSRSRGRA
jgi:hypothetical protein